jgi:HAD superfamily hydrolase (TIGR01509 family)
VRGRDPRDADAWLSPSQPENGFPVFAFRLHQLFTRGETVYATVEPEDARLVTTREQQFAPDDRSKILLPLAFCRECGQEYFTVRARATDDGTIFEPREISDRVVAHVLESYERRLPLLPGAEAAVARIAERWPLALASSSNREVIEQVMETSGWGDVFGSWVSSEEVDRGKPAPDVFLEAARRIGVDPRDAAGIEDSHNGILAARAAGLRVIAIPNHEFPPGEDALRAADTVLRSLDELTPAIVER